MRNDAKPPVPPGVELATVQYRPKRTNAALLARGIARHRATMRAAICDDAWWLGLAWSSYFTKRLK